MSKIDALLKKSKGKLTGDEVGRLIISDLIECYKHALTGGDVNTGIFTDREKSELVSAVEGKENIARYNKYRYLNDFLTRFPTLNALQEQTFENYYFRLYSLLKSAHTAENEYFFDKFRPLIVTEEHYKELVAQELEEKKSWTYTPERLFFDRLNAVLADYKAGKRTGINAKIEATKSQPIKRERIKANYWASGENGHYETKDGKTEEQVNPVIWQELLSSNDLVYIDDTSAPESATAFDVLEYAEGFYYSEETDSTETLAEFKEDYPAIWAFVWKKLTACKALSFLEGLSYADYFKECISLEELAKANAFDYRHELNAFTGVYVNGYSGLAVMKVGTINEETETLDRMPHYHFLAEHLLEGDTRDAIEYYIEVIKNSLIEIYSYNTAISIIKEKLDIDGLEIFYGDIEQRKDMIAILNDLFEQFHDITRIGKVPNEKPTEELNTELRELLKPINIAELRPSEEIIARFKEEFTLDSLEGKGLAYTSEIAQAVRDALEGV